VADDPEQLGARRGDVDLGRPQRQHLGAARAPVNKRVVVFDSEAWKFKRMWGAFGNPPPEIVNNRRAQKFVLAGTR
jgi:hypothetical protein